LGFVFLSKYGKRNGIPCGNESQDKSPLIFFHGTGKWCVDDSDINMGCKRKLFDQKQAKLFDKKGAAYPGCCWTVDGLGNDGQLSFSTQVRGSPNQGMDHRQSKIGSHSDIVLDYAKRG
jgi:hypothetical protein